MAKRLISVVVSFGLGLAAVVLLTVTAQATMVVAQDQPIAFFRVAWEQYDFEDETNTSTFQVLLPETQLYTVSVWNNGVNPYGAPNNVFSENVGFFYTYTVNTVPSKVVVHKLNWNDAEDTGNRSYFTSGEAHNTSVAGGAPDCPRRSDPYQGVAWEVRLDDLEVGPVVVLENTTPNQYYADVRDYEIDPPGGTIVAGGTYSFSGQLIEPWSVTSWGLNIWKGNVIIRAFNRPYYDENPSCAGVSWDLRDLRPPVPPVTPTVSLGIDHTDAWEGGQVGSFTLYSEQMLPGEPLTVSISLSGVAQNGTDYLSLRNQIVVPPAPEGQSWNSVQIEIVPVDDSVFEGSESVVLEVLPGLGYEIGGSPETLYILDNDFPPSPTPTPVLTPPAAPSNLLIVNGEANLNLTWQDNATNESGYRVYYSTNGSTWTTAAQLGPNETAFNITGLTCATTYQVIVQAWNAAGSSNASGQASTAVCTNPPPTGQVRVYLPLVIRLP